MVWIVASDDDALVRTLRSARRVMTVHNAFSAGGRCDFRDKVVDIREVSVSYIEHSGKSANNAVSRVLCRCQDRHTRCATLYERADAAGCRVLDNECKKSRGEADDQDSCRLRGSSTISKQSFPYVRQSTCFLSTLDSGLSSC